MGIKKDLGLVGNDFSNTATWFFIAYLIAEVPNGLYIYLSIFAFIYPRYSVMEDRVVSFECDD